MDPSEEHDGLTALGQNVRHPMEHLECFPAPADVTTVWLRSQEVVSICPVTEQPDISALVIEYEPDEWCIESKSLKLYLWSFRDRPVFCEALAAAWNWSPAAVETARRRIAEVEADMKVSAADLEKAQGQIKEAESAHQQALDELSTKQELQKRNPGIVAQREIEKRDRLGLRLGAQIDQEITT